MSNQISVLIVDDSSIMRKMIRTIFEKTSDIKGEFIKTAAISSTMGVGVKISIKDLI